MKIFYIDLFSGAGGTTTGVHLAQPDIEVIACVNHDAKAIESHKANHPNCIHFTEDVRDLKVVAKLKKIVDQKRKKYPDCIIIIWASLECTNYSRAKGGQPRDADSRTLAYALYPYIDELNPHYVMIENVVEFMSWGPLDKNGRPISKRNGEDYIKWIDAVNTRGYHHDYRILNSADFGAYTSRRRYFGIFAKENYPIQWPEGSYSKTPTKTLKPWKAVKEVLDLDDEGRSIFNRKKPLVESTLKRIYSGLIKFVAKGDDTFLKKYYSGDYHVLSSEAPAGALTTIDHHAKVKIKRVQYLHTYYGNGATPSLDVPSPTLTTKDRIAKISTHFFNNYYTGGGKISSVEVPCPILTNIPKPHLSTVNFLDQQYGQSKPTDIDKPAGTVTVNPKFSLVHIEPGNNKFYYLFNPSWFGYSSSIEKPSPVIIARQDKSPLYIIESIEGSLGIKINKNDSPTMIKIKEFMVIYGLCDIKMRMLNVQELKRIQGFPEDYILLGTKTDQKKFIGNAVVPIVAKEIATANLNSLASLTNPLL